VPQGWQSQTVCGQVHGVRAKAGVVKVGVDDGDGGDGGGGRGGEWGGRWGVEGGGGCVCWARGSERQVEQRRRCRFGSVDLEGGLMMQFCGGGEGCVSAGLVEGGAIGLWEGARWACPAYDAAAAPAFGYHVSRARANPAARHPAGVDAVIAG